MAISTSSSSTIRTLVTIKTNLSSASKLVPSTLKAPRQRLPIAGASISASANASTSKPRQHHQTILEKLHMKPFSTSSSSASSSVETLSVYEVNEGDRRSPAFLKLSNNPKEKSLGDIVTFSNKLYSGDLSARLGITAGMIMYIEKTESGGDRYEAVYSFYFGKYGHLSVQGPYFSDVDSELAVTGGTGAFEGARGKVKLTNVAYPFKLFYTFELKGIERLPEELVGGDVVKPAPSVKPLTSSNASNH